MGGGWTCRLSYWLKSVSFQIRIGIWLLVMNAFYLLRPTHVKRIFICTFTSYIFCFLLILFIFLYLIHFPSTKWISAYCKLNLVIYICPFLFLLCFPFSFHILMLTLKKHAIESKLKYINNCFFSRS